MAKGITKRAKQEVANRCAEMFERFCQTEGDRLPATLSVQMRARWISGRGEFLEKDAPEVQLEIPKPIRYNTDGRLTSKIRDYEVSITQFGRRFIPVVNGEQLSGLRMSFVEGELGISVYRKRSGGNSETLSRAVWRYLAELYNNGDPTVHYEQTKK